MSVFEYKAPQFVDFNSGLDDSDEADKFFDVEQDTPRKDENKENKSSNVSNNKETPSAGDDGNNQKKTECSTKNDNKAVLKTPLIDDEIGNSNKKRREMIKKAVRRLSEIKIKNQTTSSQGTCKDNVEDTLSQDLSNVSFKARKRTHFEGIEIKTDGEKQHGMVTRHDDKVKTPKIELRTRSVMKNGDPNENRKRKSTFEEENKAPGKYMAMAEHILHYQRDTPPRFHSHRRQSTGVNGSLLKKRQFYKPRRTIALTPKLMTSLRSRPVDVPSLQQKEEIELEEIKKHQIKANPLNEKIFLPPKLPPKFEKPKTAPAPFNLTQVAKKIKGVFLRYATLADQIQVIQIRVGGPKHVSPPTHEIGEEPYKFTANPVPRTILEKPVGIAPKKEIPITVPESPAITKPARDYRRVRVAAISNEFREGTEDLTSFGVPIPELPKRTEVKPFSFELRDKQMLEKKEKKIKEIIEAEKKMREFKAKPIPSFVASKDTTRYSMKQSHFNCSKVSLKSMPESEEPPKTFKARSPRVLRKEPFKPVTEHTHSEPFDIQLHTDRRALERLEFELKKAEKEEEIAGFKQLIEIRKKEQEEAEVAKLRKEIVHKAQPMPKFKPVPLNVKVHSSQPLTNPQSPRFTKRTRTAAQCSSNLIQK